VRMDAGQLVCREGDTDRYCVWLIKGSVETLSGGQQVRRVDAGTNMALSPLAEHQPRTLTVRTLSEVGLLKLPRDRISDITQMARESDNGIALSELSDDDDSADDWMSMLLRSPLYSNLPVTNIQRLMSSMEAIAFNRGDVIVRQGDFGDYFYFLSKGQARVVRQAREGEPPVLLAELNAGVSFGEEALVAGLPRNATVSMVTEGRVMRLCKADFEELVLAPTLNCIAWVEAEKLIAAGARWLDVRFSEEFEDDGLVGALNVPLGMLRMRLAKLERQIDYIVYCNDGKRSAAGAFLMANGGFNVRVLDGGITTPNGMGRLDGTNPAIQAADPFGTAVSPDLAAEQMPLPATPTPAPAPALATALPGNTIGITHQLKERLAEAVSRHEQAELRTAETETELRATREVLKEERTRARDMAREMQHLRQTLTDIQRQAHDALMRERSAYEEELTQAVTSLEQALLEKEMVLEVERAKNQEEVSRLRRLLDAAGRGAIQS